MNVESNWSDLDDFFRIDRGEPRILRGVAAVEGSLRNILMTIPGERVMDPLFGCALYDLLFNVNIDPLIKGKMWILRKVIEESDPRIVIRKMSSSSVPEEGKVNLDIELDVAGRVVLFKV